MQKAFILRMLQSSSFNKMLSAARECAAMVERQSRVYANDEEGMEVGGSLDGVDSNQGIP